MPTSKPRFLLTLDSFEKAKLIREMAALEGRSISSFLNQLVNRSLEPLVHLRALSTVPAAQSALSGFLQALQQMPAGPTPSGSGSDGERTGSAPLGASQTETEASSGGVAARASRPRSRGAAKPPEEAPQPSQGGLTPDSNTGVTLTLEPSSPGPSSMRRRVKR